MNNDLRNIENSIRHKNELIATLKEDIDRMLKVNYKSELIPYWEGMIKRNTKAVKLLEERLAYYRKTATK